MTLEETMATSGGQGRCQGHREQGESRRDLQRKRKGEEVSGTSLGEQRKRRSEDEEGG